MQATTDHIDSGPTYDQLEAIQRLTFRAWRDAVRLNRECDYEAFTPEAIKALSDAETATHKRIMDYFADEGEEWDGQAGAYVMRRRAA